MARQAQTKITVDSFLTAINTVEMFKMLAPITVVNETVTTEKTLDEIKAEGAAYLEKNPGDFLGLINGGVTKSRTETITMTVGDLIECSEGKKGFTRKLLVEETHPALKTVVKFTAGGLKNAIVENLTKTTENQVAEFCSAFKMAETEEISAPVTPVSAE